MVVTKLAQNKNEYLVDVYLDDKFFKTIDKNFLIEYGLVKGRSLSNQEVNDLENASIINKLINLAKNRILSRPRSISEIKQYLFRKEKQDILIDSAVKRLVDLNYLNDREFAIWWVDNRNTFRLRSRRELIAELVKKGVEKDIINEVLNEYQTADREEENIKEIAQKKIAQLERRNLSQKEKREKLLQFLQRKGYNWELIQQTQKELI